MLFLVTTARDHFQHRDIIRIYHKAKETNTAVRFLIGYRGLHEAEDVTQKLSTEIGNFNDFVIGGYEDKYENLNIKVRS